MKCKRKEYLQLFYEVHITLIPKTDKDPTTTKLIANLSNEQNAKILNKNISTPNSRIHQKDNLSQINQLYPTNTDQI